MIESNGNFSKYGKIIPFLLNLGVIKLEIKYFHGHKDLFRLFTSKWREYK